MTTYLVYRKKDTKKGTRGYLAQSTLQIVRERGAVSSLLQPLRVRMLEFLAEPESAAGLARKLEMPRQQVNYHLREMEKAGLVEQVAERRTGGLMERLGACRNNPRKFLLRL